jgi:thioredoxin reductase (NADPH)
MDIIDTIIIGSGPAGYTAGIYCGRSGLDTILFEGLKPGGQMMNTTVIENFPGYDPINGYDLIEMMKNQAIKYKCVMKPLNVINITKESNYFKIKDSNDNNYNCKTIILAMGSNPNKLQFKNADQYWNKGISSCAVCDGPLPMFRNKKVVVVGGGDSAMEEALFLSKFAFKVIILVRSDKLKASKIMINKVLENKKIKIRYNEEVVEAFGDNSGLSSNDDFLENIIIHNTKENKRKRIYCAGLFYAIGQSPNVELVKDMVELDKNNYIKKINNSMTSMEGVFTAGDISDPHYRQAITAAASGCMAAMDTIKYLTVLSDNK